MNDLTKKVNQRTAIRYGDNVECSKAKHEPFSFRKVCDEISARHLEHDFEATLIEIEDVQRSGGHLSITMQDHVNLCIRDFKRKDLTVSLHLECGELTAARLYKRFTSAAENNEHAKQIIQNFYLVTPVSEDSHQPRYNAL